MYHHIKESEEKGKYLLVYLDDTFSKANKSYGGQGGLHERLGLEREVETRYFAGEIV